MDKKALISTRYTSSSRITEQIIFLAQPKINLQSFKSTPDSLKQRFKALERKRSLGAPEQNKKRPIVRIVTILLRVIVFILH